MDFIIKFNSAVNGFVWGPIMLAFLLGVGIFFTLRLSCLQITKIPLWIKNTLGLLFEGKSASRGSVTPFQAFTTAMAATAGTGNLVGVATAILAGGPGAVFWMWVSGFFGMMTKYAEIVLSLHYRKRSSGGDLVGGPMYYIIGGLGEKFKWLSTLFAVFGSLCAFGIGNMTQINSIVGTAENMLHDLNLTLPNSTGELFHLKLFIGITLAILVALVLLGGLKRIGSVTEFLVPLVGIACILGCITAITMRPAQIVPAFRMIFRSAFQWNAAAGGAIGYTITQAVRFGIARGVFTNEAGLGSAPIAHAAATCKTGILGDFRGFRRHLRDVLSLRACHPHIRRF